MESIIKKDEIRNDYESQLKDLNETIHELKMKTLNFEDEFNEKLLSEKNQAF